MARPETVSHAVILAAQMGPRLRGVAGGTPKGFLRLGGRPIVHWSVNKLISVGIERIVIVTGYGTEAYETLSRNWSCIETVRDAEYADAGSMHSLCCARDLVEAPFLVLESDLVYELRALEGLLGSGAESAVLVAQPSEDGDGCVYVEVAGGRVQGISHERPAPERLGGEFAGICKMSQRMFAAMRAFAEPMFRERFYQLDYEDCVGRVAESVEIYPCEVEGLLWSRLDSSERVARATNRVFPQIWARDGGPSGVT